MIGTIVRVVRYLFDLREEIARADALKRVVAAR
jgi:hypothetical protein